MAPRLALVAAILLGVAALLSSCAAEQSAERSASAPIVGVVTVRVVGDAGNFDVLGRAGETEMNATGTAFATSAARLDDTQFVVTQNGSELLVDARVPGPGGHFDVTITIPEGLDIVIDTGAGNITVRDVGAVNMTVGAGNVDVDGAGGDAKIGPVGAGNIRIRNVAGDVEAGPFGAGNIDISDVTGGVEIGRMGAGNITVRDIGGDFTVGRRGPGNVTYSDIGGDVDIP